MRYLVVVWLLAVVVLVAGCGLIAGDITTTGPAAGGTVDGQGPSVTIINPDALTNTMELPEPQPTSELTAQSPTPTTTALSDDETDDADSADDEVAEDILDYSCQALLSKSDIADAIDAPVLDKHLRISEAANSGTEMTGRTKCYYGTGSAGGSKPIVVSVSQYVDDIAAEFQMGRTVASEVSAGAEVDESTVGDVAAQILIRDGGLLMLQFDSWTLAVAIEEDFVNDDELVPGLESLATAAFATLTR